MSQPSGSKQLGQLGPQRKKVPSVAECVLELLLG